MTESESANTVVCGKGRQSVPPKATPLSEGASAFRDFGTIGFGAYLSFVQEREAREWADYRDPNQEAYAA